MREHFLDVKLTVRGPVLSQATAAGDFGLDATSARRDGRILLPGSLIKGKLRESWDRLHALAGDTFHPPVGEWLGGESEEDPTTEEAKRNLPRRGRLRFSDFLAETPEDGGVRTRIRLDETRGSVAHGALAAVETPFVPGREVVFRGELRYFAADEIAAEVEAWIAAGLRWIDSVGAYRSHGFGRLKAVEVERRAVDRARSEHAADLAEPSEDGSLDLVLRIDDPLVIARFLPDRNLFECAREIPGGAIKGALATTWRELLGQRPSGPITEDLDPTRPALCQHFADIRFTHAFLGRTDAGKRPAVAPLSIVKAGAEFWDVALLEGAHLFRVSEKDDDGSEIERLRAPSFPPDWKPKVWSEVEKRLGWATPDLETRVRTAIDSEKGRNEEGQLFAHRAILPSESYAFYGGVDLGDVPEASRDEVAKELHGLLADGLRHLGKSKATARAEVLRPGDAPSIVASREPAVGEPCVLVLQTPAILVDPRALDERSERQALGEAYRDAWRDLAGSGLELVRWFTRERLAGGGYLWRRFRRDKPYHPDLLTDAGSVFVFEVGDDAAVKALKRWARHGLPLPSWAVKSYAGRSSNGEELPGDDWRRCPFLRQNGFGEVIVQPELPWKRPPEESIERIGEVEA